MKNELRYVMDSTKFPTLKKGNRGELVKLVQEWLCLNDIKVIIDSVFGSATEEAVRVFQDSNFSRATGMLDSGTFKVLVAPMRAVLRKYTVYADLTQALVFYMTLHENQRPREIGGQNRGPWVRLYMQGHDGREYPWCAGFVSFVVKQACGCLEIPMPFDYTWSAPNLIAQAKKNGNFLDGRKGSPKSGSIFCQKSKRGYSHTGFVFNAKKDLFVSMEGNTNDDGSAEGYEVCKRFRDYKRKDFVIL